MVRLDFTLTTNRLSTSVTELGEAAERPYSYMCSNGKQIRKKFLDFIESNSERQYDYSKKWVYCFEENIPYMTEKVISLFKKECEENKRLIKSTIDALEKMTQTINEFEGIYNDEKQYKLFT
jgi:hypothetical protein